MGKNYVITRRWYECIRLSATFLSPYLDFPLPKVCPRKTLSSSFQAALFGVFYPNSRNVTGALLRKQTFQEVPHTTEAPP